MPKLKIDEIQNLNSVFILNEMQAKQRYNVGRARLLEIANECGAMVKIGCRKNGYCRQKMDEWFLRHTE